MENLYKIVKFVFCFGIICLTCNIYSQESYYVNKFNGEPYLQVNDSIKAITDGMLIQKKALITLNKKDVIYFINNEGDEYKIDKAGDYKYKKLFKYSVKVKSSSVSKQYLAYLWKRYTESHKDTRSKSGVVYRGDDILLMQYPVDSAKVFGSEVSFKWFEKKDKEKNYYLILKDVATGKETIIGTPATSLTLMADDNLLKLGGSYKWAITETKYPTEKETVFYSFSLVKESEYETLNEEIKSTMNYLKQQGLNSYEIQQTLCEVYKICL